MTSDLITRLSKLDGPDREVDEKIHDLLCDGKFFSQLADAPLGQGCWMYNFPNGDVSSALYVTSSVDAVLALIDRVVPNERPFLARIAFEGECQWRASFVGGVASWSSSPAIALLIALLRAKEASNA